MTCDLLVVGGGVFGLWAARHALEAGLSVRLVEARRVGAGASGGVLGALTAHAPDRWDEKKQFQLEALAALPREIERLEAETGLAAGYRRCGRVMPIRTPAFAAQVERRRLGALSHWAPFDERFVYERRDFEAEDPRCAGWLAEDAAPEGVVFDGLAARIDPRRYLAALRAAVEARAEITEGVACRGFEAEVALLSDGTRLKAGRIVVAAGFESFALHPALGPLGAAEGGVKGRAALFDLAGVEDRPLLFEDGIYAAPHAGGRVAVGSTDEKGWAAGGEDPFEAGRSTQGDLAFLDRAAALCPPLRGLEPQEIWAGVRPKARSRDPVLGPVDEAGRIWIAGGGFKIGLGIAHRLAAALVDRMTGASAPTRAPTRFWAETQLAR